MNQETSVGRDCVADPDPDPHIFGPPGSGSISQRFAAPDPSITKQK
jgi:hypothetical protein